MDPRSSRWSPLKNKRGTIIQKWQIIHTHSIINVYNSSSFIFLPSCGPSPSGVQQNMETKEKYHFGNRKRLKSCDKMAAEGGGDEAVAQLNAAEYLSQIGVNKGMIKR